MLATPKVRNLSNTLLQLRILDLQKANDNVNDDNIVSKVSSERRSRIEQIVVVW